MAYNSTMQKIGRIGKIKHADKKAAKEAYCRQHGEKIDGSWQGPCQSCRTPTAIGQADFAHKVGAGRGGDIGGRVQASNGCFCCRPCHTFHETDPEARTEYEASEASCETGGFIRWTRDMAKRLAQFKRDGHWSNSTQPGRN